AASPAAPRRRALWAAGAVADGEGRLPGTVPGLEAPDLPAMTEVEVAAADLWATGITPDTHPASFARPRLEAAGALRAVDLAGARPGSRVRVGGVVTHRQRPATAGGTVFVNLEDETGLVNVICPAGVWARYRVVARSAPALLVRGRLERVEGVVNLVAERIEALSLTVPAGASRDFR
ncbi:MAG: OB-fold nucleic acid binding domain-containing protein, partial [Acidimicrobiales bacterium]